jgi:uncharacterized alpha-E superfamily protein
MARILGVTSNLVLFGTKDAQQQKTLLAPLSITETDEEFYKNHKKLTLTALLDFMALDESNPSSIYSCLKWARENAHAVRWQITSEMWETLNATWIEMASFDREKLGGPEATRFFDWVKERSHLFRGVVFGTMLHDDAFRFIRLGTFIERADNTARILDVKYHVLLPEEEHVGGPLDYYQWTSILRSVSALTAYHWVYRETLTPWLIADLLILNDTLPRSLASCYGNLVRNLDQIGVAYGRQGAAQRHARGIRNRLEHSNMDDIFQHGVHEFIQEFIADNSRLGEIITRQYLI